MLFILPLLTTPIAYNFNSTTIINTTVSSYTPVDFKLVLPNMSIIFPTLNNVAQAHVYNEYMNYVGTLNYLNLGAIGKRPFTIRVSSKNPNIPIVAYVFSNPSGYFCNEIFLTTSNIVKFSLSSGGNATAQNNQEICIYGAHGGPSTLQFSYSTEYNYDFVTIINNTYPQRFSGSGSRTLKLKDVTQIHYSSDYSNPSNYFYVNSISNNKPYNYDYRAHFYFSSVSSVTLITFTNYSNTSPSIYPNTPSPTPYIYTENPTSNPSTFYTRTPSPSYFTYTPYTHEPYTYPSETADQTDYKPDPNTENIILIVIIGIVIPSILIGLCALCIGCCFLAKSQSNNEDTTVHMLPEENKPQPTPSPQFYQPPPQLVSYPNLPPSYGPNNIPQIPQNGYIPYPGFIPYQPGLNQNIPPTFNPNVPPPSYPNVPPPSYPNFGYHVPYVVAYPNTINQQKEPLNKE